jgi:ABC-type multidrug transport system fused ATPase/permease subunit
MCPTGTQIPRACAPLSICPEGTDFEVPLAGIVACAVIDAALAIIVLLIQVKRAQAEGRPWYAVFGERVLKLFGLDGAPRKAAAAGSSSTPSARKSREPSVDGRVGDRSPTPVVPAVTADPDASTGTAVGKGEEAGAEGQVSVVIEKPPAPPTQSADAAELVATYRRALGESEVQMNFAFQDMGLTLPSGKVVLTGVTGRIEAGSMTAVMGPSGAGKTTFLHVLCGKSSRTSGRLIISGREAEMHTYKKLIGYVPQGVSPASSPCFRGASFAH